MTDPDVDDLFANHTGRSRTREGRDALDTEIILTIYGSPIESHDTSYAGAAQETLDSQETLWNARNATLRNTSDNDAETRRRIRRLDYGSSFHSRSIDIETPKREIYDAGTYPFQETFDGYRWPCLDQWKLARDVFRRAPLESVGSPTFSEMFKWGGEGVNLTLPLQSESNLAVALGELSRDGLPQVPGSQFQDAIGKPIRGLAGEFLNFVFGVAPTMSDIVSTKSAADQSDKLLSQWARDSGRIVRRRVTLLDESSSEVTKEHNTPQWPMGYIYTDPLQNRSTECIHYTETSRKVWFSGAYTYEIPDLAQKLESYREFDKLFGAIPDASTLYDTTPWSWLIDWHANIGDFISNRSLLGRDGLRLLWGYVMCHTTTTLNVVNAGNAHKIKLESKHRLPASANGFGFEPGDYSAKQRAVLTSLGISRFR